MLSARNSQNDVRGSAIPSGVLESVNSVRAVAVVYSRHFAAISHPSSHLLYRDAMAHDYISVHASARAVENLKIPEKKNFPPTLVSKEPLFRIQASFGPRASCLAPEADAKANDVMSPGIICLASRGRMHSRILLTEYGRRNGATGVR